MKEYYKIMEDILEVEYRIRATVYVLDELEKSYSEETDFKEKQEKKKQGRNLGVGNQGHTIRKIESLNNKQKL